MINSKLEKQIEEQRKIIDYLQKKFKETTGRNVEVPQSWQQFLCIQSDQAPILPLQRQISKKYQIEKQKSSQTFNQAVANLNLPQKLQDVPKKGNNRKKINTTSFQPTNPYHMVEVINLSGFQFRKFSKARLKELLESVVDMRCLRSIILQDNGINDTFADQIQQLLLNKRLVRVDLSRNKMDKALGNLIARLMASNNSHLQWLDLSRNPFNRDSQVVNSIYNAVKAQTRLFHFSMDIQQTSIINTNKSSQFKESVNQFLKLLNSSKPPLSSLGIIDTKLFSNSIKTLQNALQAKDCSISCLNFSYCFLDWSQIQSLFKVIRFNKTLIKIDLSNNGLGSYSGILICQALKDNISLVDINMCRNQLNNQFTQHMARMLESNNTLVSFDLSMNPIGHEGAQNLIRVLSEKNDTLESLGDIDKNLEMGIINIQKLKKLLKGNCISVQFKQKHVKEAVLQAQPALENDMFSEVKLGEVYQNQYNDYQLLKPIVFTNPLYEDPYSFRLWNI